jgi:hypothetical protein
MLGTGTHVWGGMTYLSAVKICLVYIRAILLAMRSQRDESTKWDDIFLSRGL